MIIKFNSNNLNKNKFSYFKNKMDILTFNKKFHQKSLLLVSFEHGVFHGESLLLERFEPMPTILWKVP